MVRTLVAALGMVVLAGGSAQAQNSVGVLDYSMQSNYGSANLYSGFTPDPWEVNLTAGGSLSIQDGECVGSVTNNPDFEVYWGGGQLSIGAWSNSDVTLIVNGPDGGWYCNDDWNGTDPEMTFSMSGTYDIWVGTWSGEAANATLYFTEFR